MPSSTNTALRDGGHDPDLCAFAEQELYTAVVSDSLDELGVRNQAMREYLRPLHARCTFAGWASVNDAARFEPLRVTTAADGAVRKPSVVLSENGRSAVDVRPWSSVAVTERRQAPSGAGVPSGFLPSQSNR